MENIQKSNSGANEETVVGIIKATVVLHNFIKSKETEAGTSFYNTLLKINL